MKKSFVLLVAVCVSLLAAAPALAGMLEINGSTTVLPIAQIVAEQYMKEYPNTRISLSGGGSGNGIKAIIDGTTDIANSSRFIKQSEVDQAVAKGRYPVPFAVAYDALTPVVHPSNPVSNLTLAQLKDIYLGKFKNWSELGGDNRPIVVISRDTSSGTYESWSEIVLKGERVFPGAQLLASSGAVATAVAANRNAVGYVGIGYLNPSVKAVAVEGVVGSAETAMNGTFPIARALFVFTAGWPKGETMHFINYLLHPEKGQPLVKQAGFVPLY
jgi:phosphate transport system substrate-binding protein